MHLSHSFLFILLVCFFSPHLKPPHQPPLSSPIFNTLSLCPLSIPPPPPPRTASFSSLLPSLCLPREKRFCLLLVSAPSQSAFLISSYCFCLIFKCYPRPNGNPCTHTQKSRERERGGKRNRLGIVFHSRTLRQSPPTPALSTHPPPLRERFGRSFLGVRVEVGGWVSSTNPKGATHICVPPPHPANRSTL